MLNRFRTALVSSFVGAIALGWILAQAILHFTFIIATPVSSWLSRRTYRGMLDNQTIPTGFFVQEAIPELLKSVSLLIVGCILLRWLYWKPLEPERKSVNGDDGSSVASSS